MTESALIAITGIVVLGVGAQWLAWRLGLPSILLLLIVGIIAGPVAGWIDPDKTFGPVLFPLVSISVALILYEGGLTLRLSDLPKVGSVVVRLVTLGAAITWLGTALSAHWILGMNLPLSALLGAILVVTGPTVVAPLLRHIRPAGAVGPVLRWEGIVIDPIGALLTVLVFEVILIGKASEATMHVFAGVVTTIVVGGLLGVASAALLVLLLARFWIADYLQSAVSLMLVVGSFAAANAMQHEAGLLAVTVMGFALANQKTVSVESIVEFKENLRVLLLSTLFIVLAARLSLEDFADVLGIGLLFVGVLMLVVRPLSVLVSTIGSPLSTRERLFLSWMAPRGVVAAAVASVLALRLESSDAAIAGAELLVPVTFLTIIATVVVYGLTSLPVAKYVKVADAEPQGILFAGANAWTREIAALLQQEGCPVLLVDSNWDNTQLARMQGLRTYTGSILAMDTLDELDLGGIGRFIAATPNDWVNILAVQRFQRVFGRSECFQVPPRTAKEGDDKHKHLQGRLLFGADATHATLSKKLRDGFTVKATRLSEEFGYDAFLDRYGRSCIPMFVVDDEKRLQVITPQVTLEPGAGEKIIGFVLDRGPADPNETIATG